ncbi:MAG: hypothetical protein KDI79_08530 [Anaerolineae bacterium]|nr:hypothetical protein [Anaerolineae bacterium]
MNGGIFVNLFEIQIPETFEVYSQTWDDTSTQEVYSRLYPINVYRDNNLHKLFTYGDSALDEDIYKQEGFSIEVIDTQENPKFVARFLVDAIAYFLQTQGYELSRRPYTTYKREIVNIKQPLGAFYGSLEVCQAYNIQAMYLNFDGELRYFLIVAPKLHHEFVIPLERIMGKVNCMGRFIKITCPADCNIYTCDLHRWRGKLVGRFDGFTNKGFHCEYLGTQEGQNSHVNLYDARLEVNIPVQVCHLEASLANVRYVFEGVFDKKKVNDLVRQIKVLSGDLQRNRSVNLEVGRARYEECLSFVRGFPETFETFGVDLGISQDPLRAVEGIPLSVNDIDISIEEDEDEDYGDIPF